MTYLHFSLDRLLLIYQQSDFNYLYILLRVTAHARYNEEQVQKKSQGSEMQSR
jgi:hypothetical protein